jgi:exopolysaccharide/PEP-CTERM locus tyrosine autokinase
MALIEQAAKRLEELRRAGVSIPEPAPRAAPAAAVAPATPTAPATAAPPAASVTPIPVPAARPRAPSGPTVQLDLARLASMGFITPDMPRSQIADEYRVIKRPLIANASPSSGIENGSLIMVTSSMPAEGKSFSAVNLAMSMAMEMNRTVLLVDADVARPSLPRTFDIPHTPGLLDVLGKAADLSQVLTHTNVEKLTYLSSGRHDARATEMLASDAMTELLTELRTRYPDRIVIFDSPPLLVTTEARVLATHMGQIVFVVDAERTLQNDVKRALATIEACPVKLLVLNKARTAGQGAYGYGYGYGYGN